MNFVSLRIIKSNAVTYTDGFIHGTCRHRNIHTENTIAALRSDLQYLYMQSVVITVVECDFSFKLSRFYVIDAVSVIGPNRFIRAILYANQ